MTDEATSLIMEQLHILQRGVEGRRAELAEVRTRITGFEGTMGHAMAQIGHLQSQIAVQTSRLDRIDGRFDRVDERLERIERRLDLPHA
jgi:chromosome segregation ATPase